MNKDYFIQLYQYNDWANRRVWTCAMKTSDAHYFQDMDFSIGSVYDQLQHTLAVEEWWLGYLATDEIKFHSEEEREQLKDREALRQRWDTINQRNMDYVCNLTDAELKREVKPPWWDENDPPITVSQALTQVANHSTDHRAQTMAVLHMLGYDGVGQDFLSYLDATLRQD